jgi:erythromycin esterase
MLSRRTLLARTAALLTAGGAGALPAFAAPTPPDATRADRVRWIAANAAPLRTIDMADDDVSDLEPLRQAIGDARIVLLGEQNHGDGTTFIAKSRLVRFLHEHMDFDVLAFESGLYDMPQVWKRIQAGEAAPTAARNGLYRIWSQSAEIQPLLQYVDKRARSSRPLELTGFDCKFTNQGSAHAVDDLAAVLAKSGIDTAAVAGWPQFRAVMENLTDGSKLGEWKPSAEEHQLVSTVADDLMARLAPVRTSDADYWRQILKSTKTHSEFVLHIDVNALTTADMVRRDAGMGDNLVWLARNRYPQRKIIVWAATFHNIRNIRLMLGHMKDKRFMGDFVWEAFGEQTYNIGFTTYEGARGWFNQQERPIPPADPDSLEGLWGATGQTTAFLDLRRPAAGGEWLNDPIETSLLEDPVVMYWRKALDAAIMLRTMHRANAVDV